MSIYRGVGGSGNATDDATIAEVSQLASQAATSATNAANSATSAASSASGASSSATSAANSASAAASSASNAASSASSAAGSVSLAASEADDAEASALAAAASASAASSSASSALSSANTAASARDAAEVYKDAAEAAETGAEAAYANTLAIYGDTTDVAAAVAAASSSASAASSSASAAAGSASAASTSATNAANSATAALASQNAAAGSASSASATASNITALFNDLDAVNTAVELSEGYKNDAGASAVAAALSEDNAAISETNAANSATQAAASAASASAIVLGVSSGLPSIAPTLNLDFANTETLDPRITFTRASTAAVYDGKTVAKAEENLLLQSQAFETASWTNFLRSTVSTNATIAPDGTTTAEQWIEAAVSGNHPLQQTVSVVTGQVYTFSCFFKKGTMATAPNIVQLAINYAGTVARANFDISVGGGTSGTVTAVSDNFTATISSAAGGWWRCTFTGSSITTGNGVFWLAFTNNDPGAVTLPSYVGSTTSDVFIWGAQLEQRSSVTAYTPTTTQPITNYIPVLQTAAAGVARFDHNPVTGESLGLLIEEQRTNLLLRSQEFDNASWIKNNTTVTANTVVAPNGDLTGDKLVETATTAIHRAEQTITVVSGALYTLTVYAKAAERNFLYLFEDSGIGSATFNLSTGVVGTTTGSVTTQITSVGNGWYRCALTVTQSGTIGRYRIALANSTVGYSYTGDGYSGIYIWGAQLEAGAFPTSYIPTVASQVTRSADAASMTGTNFSSWYRADEGSFYTDIRTGNGTVQQYFFATLNSATGLDNTISANTQAGGVVSYIAARGAVQAAMISAYSLNTDIKYVLAYKANDFAQTTNGGAVQTDTSGLIPVLDSFRIGSRNGGASPYTGTIKKIAYYPIRCTNSQLQALTAV